MSHLDIPRIVFTEEFPADVSTVDNDARTFPWEPGNQHSATSPRV